MTTDQQHNINITTRQPLERSLSPPSSLSVSLFFLSSLLIPPESGKFSFYTTSPHPSKPTTRHHLVSETTHHHHHLLFLLLHPPRQPSRPGPGHDSAPRARAAPRDHPGCATSPRTTTSTSNARTQACTSCAPRWTTWARRRAQRAPTRGSSSSPACVRCVTGETGRPNAGSPIRHAHHWVRSNKQISREEGI